MVKAFVDDIKLNMHHRNKEVSFSPYEEPPKIIRVDTEVEVTITCRISSRDKVQYEALNQLLNSGDSRALEIELKRYAPHPEVQVLPRTEEEYDIGRKTPVLPQGDVPEASQGKETW
jgi:hypothetical protein